MQFPLPTIMRTTLPLAALLLTACGGGGQTPAPAPAPPPTYHTYAYVANHDSNTVSQYTVGSTGALTAMTPATVATGVRPYDVTVDPSGKYAYAVNNDTAWYISQYALGSDGALTPMTPARKQTLSYPNSIAVDPSGKYAFVANYVDKSITQFTLGATGGLDYNDPIVVRDAGWSPQTVTVEPSGKYVYVTDNAGGNVFQFTIGATGCLTPMSPASVPAGSGAIAIATARILR